MPSHSFRLGDRVTAIDQNGVQHIGHLHHTNPCGQFYFLPDSPRQPFYAFPYALTATGEIQTGFAPAVDTGLGISSLERQDVYVRHREEKRQDQLRTNSACGKST